MPPAPPRRRDAGRHRPGLAAVHRLAKEPEPGVARRHGRDHRSRRIGRAVVDHDHLVDLRRRQCNRQDRPDPGRLVIGGHDAGQGNGRGHHRALRTRNQLAPPARITARSTSERREIQLSIRT